VNLARGCESRRINLATFSSDLVFDGERDTPYTEHDRPNPLCVYGKSKADAEVAMLTLREQPLVVRTSAFFGPWDSYNFLAKALSALESGLPFEAANDLVVSPTYVPDLVNTTLDLLIDEERGVWHLANTGAITWADFARVAADAAGLDASLITEKPASALGYVAARPRYSALGSARGQLMPSLEDAVARYIAECAQLLGAEAQAANA
jgi:dTDP-4-dehydrorhamnose reductase